MTEWIFLGPPNATSGNLPLKNVWETLFSNERWSHQALCNLKSYLTTSSTFLLKVMENLCYDILDTRQN
jgi:hypothetical protein